MEAQVSDFFKYMKPT